MARSSFVFRLADRPLFWALLLGGLTGRWQPALSLGIVVELLWLDVIALGSVVPPFGSLAFLLLFPLSVIPGWTEAHQFLAPLMFAVFAAYGASYAERYQRVALNPLVDLVAASASSGHGCTPGRAVALGAVVRAVWQFLYYMLCYVALWLACDLLGKGIFLFEGRMSWGMLFAASMVGGILSLRTRRAYACLMGMFVAVWGFLAVTRLGRALSGAGLPPSCIKKLRHARHCHAVAAFSSVAVLGDGAGGSRHPCWKARIQASTGNIRASRADSHCGRPGQRRALRRASQRPRAVPAARPQIWAR